MKISAYLSVRKLSACVLIIPLLFLINGAFTYCEATETDSVATVAALRGRVEAIDEEGNFRLLAVKSPIYKTETVKTGKRARVQLIFSDNTLYSLGSNTEIEITEYVWQKDKGKGTLKSKVKEGAFRIMGGAITRSSPEKFTTETPVATIGIRGSMYAGIVTPSSLNVLFQGGKGLVISNDLGKVEIDKPGFGTKVELNKPPQTPRRFTEQDIKNLEKGLAGEQEDVEEPEEQLTDTEESNEEESAVTEEEVVTDDSTSSTDDSTYSTTDEEQTYTEDFTDSTLETEDIVEIPPPNETDPVIDTTASTTTFPDKIYIYNAELLGTSFDWDGTQDSFTDFLAIEVNWNNQKILARVKEDGGPPIFALGDLDGQLLNFKIFGSDGYYDDPDTSQDPEIAALTGSGQGAITGTGYENFSIDASGKGIALISYPDQLFTWDFEASGGLIAQRSLEPAPSTTYWKGYVSAIAENMQDPDIARRFFLNKNSGDFQFSVSRDQGTLSGTLSASDSNAYVQLNNIKIGESASSFIRKDNFAAELSCPSGDCVDSDLYGQSGLREYGNFLISANPADSESKIAEYATWGYWEVSYQDPENGAPYHAHYPGSRWIAGIPTPAEEVNSLIDSGLVATYKGAAFGSRVDYLAASADQVSQLKGSVALQVNFGNLNGADAVTGSINFPDITLQVTSGAAGNASSSGIINGSVTNADVSTFNGTFFGPEAASIGGNFQAEFSDVKYIGIYGGDR